MPTIPKVVGVIGTGTIGSSWTALFLAHGLQVLVSDPASGAEETLAAHLKAVWPTMEKLGLAEGASLNNYRFVGASLEKYYGEVDFIQENAPERVGIKTKLIGEIDAGARPEVVIASSSSGLPSSQFVSECKKNPAWLGALLKSMARTTDRVLIGHPFNPPHLMPLVEVVPHPGTSAEATTQAFEFYKAVGKRPILIKREIPGFAANRLQAALVDEAYSLVANGILSASDVDAAVTTSIGPRYALNGPYMIGVMAGGGGKNGFKHSYEHMLPGLKDWLADMKRVEFKFDDKDKEILYKSVEEELADHDPDEVTRQRDELLIRLLNDKKTASLIV